MKFTGISVGGIDESVDSPLQTDSEFKSNYINKKRLNKAASLGVDEKDEDLLIIEVDDNQMSGMESSSLNIDEESQESLNQTEKNFKLKVQKQYKSEVRKKHSKNLQEGVRFSHDLDEEEEGVRLKGERIMHQFRIKTKC